MQRMHKEKTQVTGIDLMGYERIDETRKYLTIWKIQSSVNGTKYDKI
jgi:hypothetical protein